MSDSLNIINEATGAGINSDNKIIIYPIEKYEIMIKLSPTNEFLGVEGISVNKEFFSYKKQVGMLGNADVDQFYKE